MYHKGNIHKMFLLNRKRGLKLHLTSHVGVVAQRTGLVDPVLFQQLLVPRSAVQRVSETHKLPGGRTIHKGDLKRWKTSVFSFQTIND